MNVRASILLLAGAIACIGGATASAASAPGPLTGAEIDRLVTRTMAAFSVPGIAVGIVKDGKLVYARGYGVRELGKPAAVDPDTSFAIGSISKSFTTAALAILVDEGKLHWDDRVIDYLPEFRMADPFVTREFTIRDLLTHRSGLRIGAGDLLFVTPTDFTRRDLIHALRYLKPVTSFRSQFAYDNLLYVVAGEVVAAASGQSWEDFVTARILAPLGMNACAVASARLPDRTNVAEPHTIVDGKLGRVARLEIPLVGPAGSIQCNVTGMAKWAATQLAHGQAPDGTTLFSAEQGEEMWAAQTSPSAARQARGTHADALRGLRTWLGPRGLRRLQARLAQRRPAGNGHPNQSDPELGLGVIVLTNQQEGFALASIAVPILEAYAGAPRRELGGADDLGQGGTDAAGAAGDRTPQSDAASAAGSTPQNLDAYVGAFSPTPSRGAATVSGGADGLRLRFAGTGRSLPGRWSGWGPASWSVRWDDRSLNADAYVRFSRDFEGKVVGFTMKAVSASTDFSFDFRTSISPDRPRLRPRRPQIAAADRRREQPGAAAEDVRPLSSGRPASYPPATQAEGCRGHRLGR